MIYKVWFSNSSVQLLLPISQQIPISAVHSINFRIMDQCVICLDLITDIGGNPNGCKCKEYLFRCLMDWMENNPERRLRNYVPTCPLCRAPFFCPTLSRFGGHSPTPTC